MFGRETMSRDVEEFLVNHSESSCQRQRIRLVRNGPMAWLFILPNFMSYSRLMGAGHIENNGSHITLTYERF